MTRDELKKQITQIIEDTSHSGRADELIDEILIPLAKEAFEAGSAYIANMGNYNDPDMDQFITEKFGIKEK